MTVLEIRRSSKRRYVQSPYTVHMHGIIPARFHRVLLRSTGVWFQSFQFRCFVRYRMAIAFSWLLLGDVVEKVFADYLKMLIGYQLFSWLPRFLLVADCWLLLDLVLSSLLAGWLAGWDWAMPLFSK